MDAEQKYEMWLGSDQVDEYTKKELISIRDNAEEIEDRFYTNLEFGTGGLRGVMGAGTNRMNIYTVRMATQGIANYLAKLGISEPSAAIAFDNRNNASLYALETALCLCANGVKVYLFDALRPTPELSFAVRYLHCNIGVNITASHNPKEYNGYKVYWDDGAQIVSPQDKEIIAEVNNIEDFSMVKTMDKDAAIDAGLLNVIGQEIDDAYIGELHKLVMNPEEIQKAGDLKIVYSPLHGTGLKPVTRVLSELGFKDVHVVEEQAVQDGNFPTVSYPNPEDPKPGNGSGSENNGGTGSGSGSNSNNGSSGGNNTVNNIINNNNNNNSNSSNKNSGKVQTGDRNNLVFPLIGMTAAILAIATVLIIRKKKRL